MTYVIIGVLVGGRLGYVLFYQPALLVGFAPTFPFWDLLAINKGGMASHGGVLGVIGACWLFGRRHRISSLHLLDMGALTCTPGLFLGRLANFVNAELWGQPLPAARQSDPPWWSVKYPQEILQWPDERLEELTGAAAEVGVEPAIWQSLLQTPLRSPEDQLLVDRVLEDIVEAAQSGNQAVIEVFETLRPTLTAYYPSQLIQALTDGPLLAGVIAVIWIRPRKPGVIGCSFLIAYGVMRLLSELLRQPDPGVATWAGLSRGQILSVLMVVLGTVLLVRQATRDAEPMAGWIKKPKEGNHHRGTEDTEAG
jgi:phosphatidylglycerol:prolipoprotein diacylglycerol transferase